MLASKVILILLAGNKHHELNKGNDMRTEEWQSWGRYHKCNECKFMTNLERKINTADPICPDCGSTSFESVIARWFVERVIEAKCAWTVYKKYEIKSPLIKTKKRTKI